MVLPTAANAASSGADWIVGATPGAAADAIAARHGGRRLGTGSYAVATGRARELAAALKAKGLLLYAEADRLEHRMQVPPPDPLDAKAAWRAAIVDPSLVPPPVTDTSPMLALVDATADVSHPEFQGGHSPPSAASRWNRARDRDRRRRRRAQERPRHPRRLARPARAQRLAPERDPRARTRSPASPARSARAPR